MERVHAGLYDSIPVVSLRERPLDYAGERLFWDAAFQQELLGGMAQLGRDVEVALGGQPQVCTLPQSQDPRHPQQHGLPHGSTALVTHPRTWGLCWGGGRGFTRCARGYLHCSAAHVVGSGCEAGQGRGGRHGGPAADVRCVSAWLACSTWCAGPETWARLRHRAHMMLVPNLGTDHYTWH